MSPVEIASVIAVLTVAAAVQGSIGFGMALIAAPILVLIEPRLVPGPLMGSTLLLVVLIAVRDHAHADFKTVRWALAGYVVGAGAGASLLVRLDPAGFSIVFALLVLLAVLLSVLGVRVRVRRRSAMAAGTLGGFMGTTTAIGGPPVALVYQHVEQDQFRGTLATYFIVSNSVGLTALWAVGRYGGEELVLSLILVPGQVFGFLLSNALARLIRDVSIRPFILGLSTLAALAVLVRVLL